MPVFLFTDIENSTKLWQLYRDPMAKALASHDHLVQARVEEEGGRIVSHGGDGVFAAFDGGQPLQAALRIQQDLAAQDWGELGRLRVRMGVHAGHATLREGNYFGPEVNRAARVMAAGWGGQILMTPEALRVCDIPPGATAIDLGLHRLKDLAEPQPLFWLDHPSLPQHSFPPLRSLASVKLSGIKRSNAPFLGRERELVEIEGLLQDNECRLLTLVGPGGIGKTRLAQEAAARFGKFFAHGAVYVALEACQTEAAFLAALAEAAGMEREPSDDLRREVLGRWMGVGGLLVLDNFEQLGEAVSLLGELLDQTADLKLLVTSRHRLAIHGEWVMAMEGLSLPQDGSAAALDASESGRLFLLVARRQRPAFLPDPEEAADIAKICALVEGVPLALEMAAARIRTLDPATIAAEIRKNFDFLQTSFRDSKRGHVSIRAVFETSWQLLSDQEKRTFAALSYFAGSFGLEGAKAVAGGDAAILEALVDKSLVRAEEKNRFSVHALLRHYAFEHLGQDPGLLSQIKRAHSHYVTGWMEALLQQQKESAKMTVSRNLLLEMDKALPDVIRAWDDLVDSGDGPALVRAATALMGYVGLRRDRTREFEGMFQRAAEGIKATGSPREQADLLGLRLQLVLRQGKFEEAPVGLEQNLGLLRQASDKRALAWALGRVAAQAEEKGDLEAARRYLSEKIALIEMVGDSWGVITALVALGHTALKEGDTEGCAQAADRAEQLARERGLDRIEPDLLELRASLDEVRGDFNAALERWRILKAICIEGSRPRGRICEALLGEAACLLEKEDPEGAATVLGQARSRIERNNVGQWVGLACLNAELALLQGQAEQTIPALTDALRYAFAMSQRSAMLRCLLSLSAVHLKPSPAKTSKLARFILAHPSATFVEKRKAEALLRASALGDATPAARAIPSTLSAMVSEVLREGLARA